MAVKTRSTKRLPVSLCVPTTPEATRVRVKRQVLFCDVYFRLSAFCGILSAEAGMKITRTQIALVVLFLLLLLIALGRCLSPASQ